MTHDPFGPSRPTSPPEASALRDEITQNLRRPPTPLAMPARVTQRAFAAVRAPVERRILTVISGPNAGQLFTLRLPHHVLGRGELADFQVEDPDVSRIHARFHREDDGNYLAEDASSTNGTFVGAERITRAVLKSGDRLQCGTTLVLRYSVSDDIEQELHERMLAATSRDFLTRLYNRAHLTERLAGEIAHARRHNSALSLLVIDVDGLRHVNETHGLDTGDVLLRAIAGRLARLVRAEDVIARSGGDEFTVLARTTPLAAATGLAERLRAAVHDSSGSPSPRSRSPSASR